MRLTLLAVAALCVSSCSAHADTFQTFDFNATLSQGVANGTLTLDETTGLFTGGDIIANYNSHSFNFNVFGESATYDTITFEQQSTANGKQTFQVAIPGVSNANYKGGYVCSDAHEQGCQVTGGPSGDYYYTGFVYNGNNNFASTGTLSATPEPSSLILLGSGILGVAGVIRRRLV